MRWTVSRKLALGFIAMLLLTTITAVLALSRMMYIQNRVEQVTENSMPKVNGINRIYFETEYVLNLVFRHKDSTDAPARKTLEDEIGASYALVESTMQQYESQMTADEERKDFASFKENWEEFKKNTQKTLVSSRSNPQQAMILIDAGHRIFDEMQEHLTSLVEWNQKQAEISALEAKKAYKDSLIWVYVILGISVAVAIGISTLFLLLIARPLRLVTGSIVRVADGDLTVPPLSLKSRDETGQLADALNRMVRELHSAVGRSSEASHQVTQLAHSLAADAGQTTIAAQQIADASRQVAGGAQAQLTTSKETAVVMEEMAAGIGRISEATSDMAEQFQTTAANAVKGTESMDEAEEQMNAISTTAKQTSERMERLSKRSDEIGGIVKLISEIAYQTNLLALNASIEAARAGESGRGFAVVAAEVKKLATQSEAAAKEIAQRIHLIQEETKETAGAIHEVTEQVTAGIHLVSDSGRSFRDIAASIEQLNGHIVEVSATAEEMAATTEQITASVTSTAMIAQTSSDSTESVAAASNEQFASMERISGSAESLTLLAGELRESIRRFRL
ncbi:methyl-accepting chemotaxis protein [Paenibacillus tianmuensis]|uniref:Methyl-accepting chemotaxis protein n=1 Tax=Paenibacillus tianmuensis TaxID=624147 RepID=A0A1G4SNT3_9BACL|nr:methyl-accepting chemotaxis protein [Paenibacillus tianmuensis]SCW70830.1 methyl-accepting chemotaxis protein [Paenibacillus tianmuensis]